LLKNTIYNELDESAENVKINNMSSYLQGDFSNLSDKLTPTLSGLLKDKLTIGISDFESLMASDIDTKNIFYNSYEDFYNKIGTNNGSIETAITTFNDTMKSLPVLSNWTPALTNCLIEPMKIMINFGQPTIEKNEMSPTFDIDIKVNINDPIEKNNAVGWRCGSKNTKYLSWISGDSRDGRSRNCISRY
jgi:hypothetical protein